MKKIFALILVLAVMAAAGIAATGCGNNNLGDPDERLVGTWDWMGNPYYVFNADGTGTMSGTTINWGVRGNAVYICSTTALCRGRCSAPTRWTFSIEDDTLTLTGLATFTYTRRTT